MHPHRKSSSGDAFERALKGAFGEQASFGKIGKARALYARYRTDDLLDRLKGAVDDKNNEAQSP